jgi:tetratricopeptide (TPR) repeat protein
MATLALCMIVKDEQNNLPNTLESVKALVDEIVILDTGSTDSTVQIAKSYGAKVREGFSWSDDFALARNEALEMVQSDWVLVLDADEILKQEAISKIKKVIEKPNTLVVNLLRQEIGASQSPYSLVSRLFLKHESIKFTRPYHAIVDDSVSDLLIKEPHWQILELDEVSILHYGYSSDVIAKQNKFERAQKAMEAYLSNEGADPYLCSKLGALYLEQGKYKEGMKLLKRGLKSNKASIPVFYELQYHLANAYLQHNKIDSAIKHYHRAIELPLQESLKLGAYNNLAAAFLSLEKWNVAKEIYKIVLKIDPDFGTAYYNLGIIYTHTEKFKKAIQCYQQAINLSPDDAKSYQNMAVAWLKYGNYQESFVAFKKAIEIYQKQDPNKANYLINEIKSIGMYLND